MLKKIMCIIISAALISVNAFAQITFDISDAANDIITLTSSGTAGKSVSVMIINPGYTKENALAGSDGAIQYFNSFVPASADYSIPVKIMGNSGGKFGAYIKSSDMEDVAEFTFYNSVFKQKCIDDINAASSGEDITPYFENLVNAYSKSDDPTYIALGSKAVSDAFLLLRDTMPGKVLPDNIEEVFNLINRSFTLAAYNTHRNEFCFSGDAILNPSVIGISSSAELIDYNSNLSSDGKAYIRQKLILGGYKNIEEIANRFKSLVHRGVLLNYKNLGYGHIHSYLSVKYRSAYEAAGFIIPSKESASKYNQLLSLTDEALPSLAEKFNDFKETNSGISSNPGAIPKPGNSGSVGGSFSTGGVSSFVDPNPIPSNPPAQSGSSFNDMSSNHWASASVDFLKGNGWITGYEDGSFRPDNNITRAEYAKLILNVFDIKEGGEANFNDVSNDAWYAPFVASAQANGIITGIDGSFFPERNLTRQDAAVIICRILGKSSAENLTFADKESIADYAVSAVSYLCGIGVINGYSDNTFKPEGYITRAEISKIIHTLSKKGGIK